MKQSVLGASLFVGSIPHSVAFYRDMLGFEFEGFWDGEKNTLTWGHSIEQPRYASFRLGESKLGLFLNEGDKVVGNAGVFHMMVPDVKDYHRTLKERGLFVKPPVDASCDTCILTIDDPDGHLWNFYSVTA